MTLKSLTYGGSVVDCVKQFQTFGLVDVYFMLFGIKRARHLKIRDVTETMKTGPSESDLGQIYDHLIKTHYPRSQHIGDMGFIKVFYIHLDKTHLYFFVRDGKPIGFSNTVDVNDGVTFENVYVEKSERNRKVLSSFILFLKRVEKVRRIHFGKYHSPDMVDVVKRLSKRYNLQWLNTDTGETVDYDPMVDDPYYDIGEPTAWEVILEKYDTVTQWERYIDLNNPTQTMLYESFIDDLE